MRLCKSKEKVIDNTSRAMLQDHVLDGFDGLWSILHLTVGLPFMYIDVINLVWYCVLEFIRRVPPPITICVPIWYGS